MIKCLLQHRLSPVVHESAWIWRENNCYQTTVPAFLSQFLHNFLYILTLLHLSPHTRRSSFGSSDTMHRFDHCVLHFLASKHDSQINIISKCVDRPYDFPSFLHVILLSPQLSLTVAVYAGLLKTLWSQFQSLLFPLQKEHLAKEYILVALWLAESCYA